MMPLEVHLRPMMESDIDKVRSWRNHPDVRRFMYTTHEISAAEHLRWYVQVKKDPNRYPLVAECGDDPIGFVNFSLIDVPGKRADWGFYLAPEASRGNGAALGRAALEYAFVSLGVHKLCGEALASNVRSIRFHERLGFTREAYLRDHHFDGSTYHDVIGFGLLKTEWLLRQGV